MSASRHRSRLPKGPFPAGFLEPTEQVGSFDGSLITETNDPGQPRIQVPLTVEVTGPITVSPDSLFFGFVKAGATQTASLTLTSTVPFEITATKADKPTLITVEVREGDNGSYLLQAALHAPNQPGTVEGNIELSTSLVGQPTVSIPYYVQISATE